MMAFVVQAFAQPGIEHFGVKKKKNNKVENPWLPKGPRYARAGWFGEAGGTIALGFKHEETELEGRLQGTFKPGIIPAFYVGGGRYRLFKKGPIHYLDYGLAWKQLKGTEEFTGGYVEDDGSVSSTVFGEGIFKENYAVAHLNFNNVQTVGRFNFVQNTLGLNFDWRFMEKNSYEGGAPGINTTGVGPNTFGLQLHYKFGWGYKLNNYLFIIPQVETPIVNILKFENFKSTHLWFNTRYRPIIFSVRLLFLRDSNKVECPPVYGNPDDKAKQEGLDGM